MGYSVRYYLYEGDSKTAVSITDKTRSTNYRARFFEPNTIIFFEVAAYNSAGNGHYSPAFICMPESDPVPMG